MITHHKLNRWIKLAIILVITTVGHAQIIIFKEIYIVENGDSVLTKKFITEACEAARYPLDPLPGKPFLLEQLILKASNSTFKSDSTPVKTNRWFKHHGQQCHCEADEKYPAGNLLRQVVLSDYREFANIIGPNKRLALDLYVKDKADGLNIFQFVDKKLQLIEGSHDNDREAFQKDEKWKNIMFFYFLFSEYKINYGAQLKE